MKNVVYEIQGDVLTIKVNLAMEFGQSGSGKSTVIATTEGNPEIKEGISMGLNVYKKRAK